VRGGKLCISESAFRVSCLKKSIQSTHLNLKGGTERSWEEISVGIILDQKGNSRRALVRENPG